jgi:hypothetical protein
MSTVALCAITAFIKSFCGEVDELGYIKLVLRLNRHDNIQHPQPSAFHLLPKQLAQSLDQSQTTLIIIMLFSILTAIITGFLSAISATPIDTTPLNVVAADFTHITKNHFECDYSPFNPDVVYSGVRVTFHTPRLRKSPSPSPICSPQTNIRTRPVHSAAQTRKAIAEFLGFRSEPILQLVITSITMFPI